MEIKDNTTLNPNIIVMGWGGNFDQTCLKHFIDDP